MNNGTALKDVVKNEYINEENAVFSEHDGMLSMKLISQDDDKDYDRVFLHRCFPHELEDGYISVLDREQNEICMIRSLSDFSDDVRKMLERELKRRYRVSVVKRIKSVNERYGYSYWKIEDENGACEFTVRDTYRSITKISSDRIYITDVDGNRYEIPSLEALDRKSFRKIELFL